MDVKFMKHGMGHVLPSLFPGRQELCASRKSTVAQSETARWLLGIKDCEGWDTVGNMWSFILPRPFVKVADL
jgi:hypothetical protein